MPFLFCSLLTPHHAAVASIIVWFCLSQQSEAGVQHRPWTRLAHSLHTLLAFHLSWPPPVTDLHLDIQSAAGVSSLFFSPCWL